MYAYGTYGTVKPAPNFNANSDAEVLRKAMKGLGTDEKAIIDVICKRSNIQRQQIAVAFKQLYGKDLVKDLVSELKGNFEDIIVALMMPTADYDAALLHKAMKGVGTNESILIEILGTRSNAEIHAARQAFKRLYHQELEQWISSETSGHFKRLLVSLCQGARQENPAVDVPAAARDAKALYEAGEKKIGTDESQFNAVICAQSRAQLDRVFNEYYTISGHHIEEGLKKEFSGDLLDGLMTVVKCIKNPAAYFAEKLHESMKGIGTKDDMLIRTIVTRSEVDLALIKQEFQKLYGTSLESMISSDTSGDYKNALLALVHGN